MYPLNKNVDIVFQYIYISSHCFYYGNEMKKITSGILAFVVVVSCGAVLADSIVTVGGQTYKCDNACNVDTSTNPPTVTDCCGGDVWIRKSNYIK